MPNHCSPKSRWESHPGVSNTSQLLTMCGKTLELLGPVCYITQSFLKKNVNSLWMQHTFFSMRILKFRGKYAPQKWIPGFNSEVLNSVGEPDLVCDPNPDKKASYLRLVIAKGRLKRSYFVFWIEISVHFSKAFRELSRFWRACPFGLSNNRLNQTCSLSINSSQSAKMSFRNAYFRMLAHTRAHFRILTHTKHTHAYFRVCKSMRWHTFRSALDRLQGNHMSSKWSVRMGVLLNFRSRCSKL